MSNEPTLDPEVLAADLPLEADAADVLEQRQEVPASAHEDLVLDESGEERVSDEHRGIGGSDL